MNDQTTPRTNLYAWSIAMENTTSLNSSTLHLSTPIPSQDIANILFITPFTLSFSCFILFVFNKFMQRQANAKPSRPPLPPALKPWPILGNLPQMLWYKPFFRWIHNHMKQMDTDIACVRLGNVHIITVTCPEIARKFLGDQDAVFASRPICMSAEVVTNGYRTVFSQPFGDHWKKEKKNLGGHILSSAKYQWLAGKRLEEADNLLWYVYNQCCGSDKAGLVNVRTTAKHYCINVIRKLVFSQRYFGEGKEDRGPGVEEEEHVEAILTLLLSLYSFCISDYLPWLRRFDFDGQEKILKGTTAVVGKYHDPIIKKRIQQWKDGTKEQEDDLLDVLINLKGANGNETFSEEEIKGQITELMVASVDNPSNAMEWTLAEMLNQPEILQKAVEELDMVVGKDRLVQESDLRKLNYIKACVREAFRLHPFAPFNIPHVSTSDTTVAGYLIPKGSRVLLSRMGLGRNPKVWEEPLNFMPERHLKNDGSDVALIEPELRFISFSTGRRGCPGVTLGTSMTVMLFARLLQGFSWSLPPNQSKIDLSEAGDDLTLAKPLVALAKPRLPENLYPC